MNFLSIVFISYIIVAFIIILILLKDLYSSHKKLAHLKKIYHKLIKKIGNTFWVKKHRFGRTTSWILISILGFGILMAVDARFIEPYVLTIKKQPVEIAGINKPLKIALITDIQVRSFKKQDWVEKIVKRIIKINPDLVLLGGDEIDNEGIYYDESQFLTPLKELVGKYPIYYILGNHEYGIGGKTQFRPDLRTGDQSELVIKRMAEIGIPLLRNQLSCPEINQQKICIFGADDIWKRPINFTDLKKWNQKDPLIFLVHNPDGIIYWPKNIQQPNLVLAGHTHGGQIRLPFIGPLGKAQLDLPKNFYKGLNYYNSTPVYTSVGVGESGGPVRFMDPPEISVIELNP